MHVYFCIIYQYSGLLCYTEGYVTTLGLQKKKLFLSFCMTFSDEKGVLKRRGSSILKPFFYNHVVSDDNDIHLHERVPNLGLANFEVSYILLRV